LPLSDLVILFVKPILTEKKMMLDTHSNTKGTTGISPEEIVSDIHQTANDRARNAHAHLIALKLIAISISSAFQLLFFIGKTSCQNNVNNSLHFDDNTRGQICQDLFTFRTSLVKENITAPVQIQRMDPVLSDSENAAQSEQKSVFAAPTATAVPRGHQRRQVLEITSAEKTSTRRNECL
jgi:hypothetical protein